MVVSTFVKETLLSLNHTSNLTIIVRDFEPPVTFSTGKLLQYSHPIHETMQVASSTMHPNPPIPPQPQWNSETACYYTERSKRCVTTHTVGNPTLSALHNRAKNWVPPPLALASLASQQEHFLQIDCSNNTILFIGP